MYSCAYVWTWVSDSGCTWCECCSSFFLVACSICACTWKAAFRCSCQVKCPVSAYSANRAHCKVQIDIKTSPTRVSMKCSTAMHKNAHSSDVLTQLYTCAGKAVGDSTKVDIWTGVSVLQAGLSAVLKPIWQVTSCWMLSSKQPYQYMTWLLWSTYTEGKTACLLQSCAAWKYHPKKTCCTHV